MDKLIKLKKEYEDMLYNSVVKFWLDHSLDEKHKGYYSALDRKGNVIDTDKAVWLQGRGAWMFANMYNDFDKKEEYLRASKLGIDFLEKYCFDKDGKMFFRMTEDGRPLVRRERYIFSETFCLIAFAAYAKASGDKSYIEKARELLKSIEKYLNTEGLLPPKFNPAVRPSIGFAVPMIMLATIAELRKVDEANKKEYDELCGKYLEKAKIFVKDDKKVVMEQLNPDGSMQDHLEGRLLNPGHAIEAAWFIMNEGYVRENKSIMDFGIKMLDYMWEWGWDNECGGGIIYYQDIKGLPKTEYWHDMKFWWPQNEASIATLYAYMITKDEKYLQKHFMVHEYTQKYIDKEYGEWFGYLHRDGRISTEIKGGMWKGPFHVPRMYMRNIELLNIILK